MGKPHELNLVALSFICLSDSLAFVLTDLLCYRYGAMQDVDEAIKRRLAEAPQNAMLTEEVAPEEVAQIVSSWTGIPVSKLQQGERHCLLQVKNEVHQHVVGQDKAVEVRSCISG